MTREGAALDDAARFVSGPLGASYAGADLRLVRIGLANGCDLTPFEEAASRASGGGFAGIPQKAQAWRERLRGGLTAEQWLGEQWDAMDAVAGTPLGSAGGFDESMVPPGWGNNGQGKG